MTPTTVPTFAAALEPANYASVPDDWYIAVGDVVQSTPAIAAGRYKDVNLAGAATIAAILNASPSKDLPFAFGGDGGIVLVPPELKIAAQHALKGVQQIARNALDLNIRCALVPVRAVRMQGSDVKLAYQMIGPARKLAMLSGGGIDASEAIARSPDGAQFMVNADATTQDADLTGLSCRWQPLRSRAGAMLTLIVRAKDESSALSPVYRRVYDRIQSALAADACPVALENLKFSWPPRGADRELRYGATLFEVYGVSFLAKVSEVTGLTIGGYNGRAYTRSLPSHSDYRKFADSLRMVVDCSTAEADRIEALLAEEKALGRIEFGVHRATAALMTCFVSHPDEGKHVHFIDGAGGGYAMAAQQLKARIESKI